MGRKVICPHCGLSSELEDCQSMCLHISEIDSYGVEKMRMIQTTYIC